MKTMKPTKPMNLKKENGVPNIPSYPACPARKADAGVASACRIGRAVLTGALPEQGMVPRDRAIWHLLAAIELLSAQVSKQVKPVKQDKQDRPMSNQALDEILQDLYDLL